MNFLFNKMFELVSLFFYQMNNSKLVKKLDFMLLILFGSDIFAIKPNLLAWCRTKKLYIFIMNLLFKILGIK